MGLSRMLKEGVEGEEKKLLNEVKPKETRKTEAKKEPEKQEKPVVADNKAYKKTGELKRKQYTVTMDPSFYELINEYRINHKMLSGRVMSFSAMIETAMIEYMENHA